MAEFESLRDLETLKVDFHVSSSYEELVSKVKFGQQLVKTEEAQKRAIEFFSRWLEHYPQSVLQTMELSYTVSAPVNTWLFIVRRHRGLECPFTVETDFSEAQDAVPLDPSGTRWDPWG